MTDPDPLGDAVRHGIARIRASEKLTGDGVDHQWSIVADLPNGESWCITIARERIAVTE